MNEAYMKVKVDYSIDDGDGRVLTQSDSFGELWVHTDHLEVSRQSASPSMEEAVPEAKMDSLSDRLERLASNKHNILIWKSSEFAPSRKYYAWSTKLGKVCDTEADTVAEALANLEQKLEAGE